MKDINFRPDGFFVRRLRIVTLVVYLCGIAIGLSSDRQPACLFDNWAPNQEAPRTSKEVGRWKSPSGAFSVIMFSDNSGNPFVLIGENVVDKSKTILGYGERGADIKWVSTKAGEIVTIDNSIDNGTNEIFVVKPSHLNSKDSWTLLYKTPDVKYAAGHIVAHCYWDIVGVDRNMGSLRLKASWDFSDITNAERRRIKTEGTYDVPIFYGYK